MGEHDNMSSADVHALVQSRLAQGLPVGRLINTLQSRDQSTSGYQSQRTTSDLAAHVRWKSYQGQAAPEESRALSQRSEGGGPSSDGVSGGEHASLTTDEVRALIQRRLAEGKPVGRLINTLQSRGQSTVQYQSQRTTEDIAAHVRWKSHQGQAASEETQELEQRAQAKPWWKFW